MKYMSLLILVLLVGCSTPKPTKMVETVAVDSSVIVKPDTISNVFVLEKLQMIRQLLETKEINPES